MVVYINLAILKIKLTHLSEAMELMNSSIKNLKEVQKENRLCLCLFLPEIEKGEIEIKEVYDCDLLDVVKKAIRILESALESK